MSALICYNIFLTTAAAIFYTGGFVDNNQVKLVSFFLLTMMLNAEHCYLINYSHFMLDLLYAVTDDVGVC